MTELEAFTVCGKVTAKINADLRTFGSNLDTMLDNIDKTSAVLGNWLAMWSQVNQQQAELKKGTTGAPIASHQQQQQIYLHQ